MLEFRVVHYINQFFAGVGGEEKADTPPNVLDGAAGSARGLQQHLGSRGRVVATVYCGDNYFHRHKEAARSYILEQVRARKPQVLLAGPAFGAGRYGLACVEVCQEVALALGIPCVMGMSLDNPAMGTYQRYKNLSVFCFSTPSSPTGMNDALMRMARLAERLAAGAEVGSAREEGYIHRGIHVPGLADKPAAERAADMLFAKMSGLPFQTEVPVEILDRVVPAPRIKDLSRAKVAVVTTSGVVPPENPDGFRMRGETRWARYTVDGLRDMRERKWDVRHGGYNVVYVRENANYTVPLDVLRELEDAGVLGSLHPDYYVTANAGTFAQNECIGREMGRELKLAGVEGVLLVST